MGVLGEGFDLITATNDQRCTQCASCTRHCPSHAIRSTNGCREIIPERCVSCGACVIECPNDGFIVRDDLPRVRALLASGRRVVVVLASEFVAALNPLSQSQIERRLEAIGFAAVETTVLGEELVAAEYERVHSSAGVAFPRLRSTCPVVVYWVERFYPQLTDALVPVVPPYIAPPAGRARTRRSARSSMARSTSPSDSTSCADSSTRARARPKHWRRPK